MPRFRVLLGHEADEEVHEQAEEDNRLAHRHERAADLLVLERLEAPEPRGFHIGVVERRGKQCEEKAERAREDECGEEVGGLAARR